MFVRCKNLLVICLFKIIFNLLEVDRRESSDIQLTSDDGWAESSCRNESLDNEILSLVVLDNMIEHATSEELQLCQIIAIFSSALGDSDWINLFLSTLTL